MQAKPFFLPPLLSRFLFASICPTPSSRGARGWWQGTLWDGSLLNTDIWQLTACPKGTSTLKHTHNTSIIHRVPLLSSFDSFFSSLFCVFSLSFTLCLHHFYFLFLILPCFSDLNRWPSSWFFWVPLKSRSWQFTPRSWAVVTAAEAWRFNRTQITSLVYWCVEVLVREL